MEQNRRRRKKRRTNPKRTIAAVVLVIAAIVIVYLIFSAIAGFVKKKGESIPTKAPESAVEENTTTETTGHISKEYDEVVEDYKNIVGDLADFDNFTIDGDTYTTGAKLSDIVANGWQIVGNPYDPDWIYDETMTLKGEEIFDLLLVKGESEMLTVGILNPSTTEAKSYTDCLLASVSVHENDGQSVQSITLNGENLWGLSIESANKTFESHSEDAGMSFFYFNVPENSQKYDNITATGWSVCAGSDTNTGKMDWVSFDMDYMIQ